MDGVGAGMRGRRRWLGLLVILAVALLVLAIAAYIAASVFVYDKLSRVTAGCPPTEDWVDIQDPTSFRAKVNTGSRDDPAWHEVDTSPYRMPSPQDVSFGARGQSDVRIAAWWEPVGALDAPTVIVVHGTNGCRRNSGNLLVAGMLHRNGIAVLLIDLREHGDSTARTGRYSGGYDEHPDVLGAFDWLRAQGVPADRIGVLGFSLGSSVAMIAAGEEPQIRAVWADSAPADIHLAIQEELARNRYPAILEAGGLLAGKLLAGDDIAKGSPLLATAKLADRSVFLVQGSKDARIDPHHLADLAAGMRAAGGTAETWLVDGAGHTQAHFIHPTEYERRLAAFFTRALGSQEDG